MEEVMACIAMALSFGAFCVALLDHVHNRKCNRPVPPATTPDQSKKIVIPPSVSEFKNKKR